MSGKRKLEEFNLTPLQTEKIIELYHSEVDLWDMSSPNCYKKDSRHRALQAITENMMSEFPGLHCNIEQVQAKLSYLRGYYSRELAKVNRSIKDGASIEDGYKSSWQHFKALDAFLRFQISPRVTQTNINTSYFSQLEDYFIESDYEETSSHTSEVSTADVNAPPRKKTKLARPEIVMQRALSCLEDLKTHLQKEQESPPDDDEIFGQYVTSELRKIMDERTKAYLKFKIQSLVFEAQLKLPPGLL